MPESGVTARRADPYSVAVRYHLEHTERGGRFPPDSNKEIGRGDAGSIATGGFVRIYCRLHDNGTLDARFEVFGGPFLIAAASWYCTTVSGAQLSDPIPSGLEAAQALCLPRSQHGNTLLVEDALREALKQFQ